MARTARAPGLPLWLPIALIVLGLGAGAVPGVVVVSRLVRSAIDTFDAPTIDTPTEVGLVLDADRYLVFERMDVDEGASLLSTELVQVVDADTGAPIAVETCSCGETITKGDRTYEATLFFDVPASGRHALRFAGPPDEVIITKGIGDAIGGIVPWLAYAGLAAAVVAVGVGLLVVSLVGRRRPAGTSTVP